MSNGWKLFLAVCDLVPAPSVRAASQTQVEGHIGFFDQVNRPIWIAVCHSHVRRAHAPIRIKKSGTVCQNLHHAPPIYRKRLTGVFRHISEVRAEIPRPSWHGSAFWNLLDVVPCKDTAMRRTYSCFRANSAVRRVEAR